MAKTRECCGALSLRRTGDDLHVSLHKGFKIRLAGIVPVFIEFTDPTRLVDARAQSSMKHCTSSSNNLKEACLSMATDTICGFFRFSNFPQD